VVRRRTVVAFVILACGIALWPQAASASVELKLNYWPTTNSISFATPGLGNNSWTESVWGGDLRWTSDESHWGIHLKYDTGSKVSWAGVRFATLIGGTDTFWSGDVFYAWQTPAFTLRGFVGYGDLEETDTYGPCSGPGCQVPGTSTAKSSGYRIGADATIPIPNSNFAFNASVAWYPSNTTIRTVPAGTFPGLTLYATGSATDISASVQYTWPEGWLAEVGYRWISWDSGPWAMSSCPCTLQYSAPFFAAGYHF
jgi:hypothetical protein